MKYAPGTLSAKGFDAAGKVIAETKVETTGDATQIQLTPDRKTINADGEDVAVFTVAALDAQGRVVPVAQNKINFAIEGAGKIIGVGNGDPSCHEPDTYVNGEQAAWSRSLFNGLAQVIVQSTQEPGEIKLTAESDGLTPATAVVQTRPSRRVRRFHECLLEAWCDVQAKTDDRSPGIRHGGVDHFRADGRIRGGRITARRHRPCGWRQRRSAR